MLARCVYASGGLLRWGRLQAAGAGGATERMEYVRAALPAWRPEPGAFDAVATHFFLDCFPPAELAEVVRALAEGARAKATWLVTDFAVPRQGLARQRARAVHALMYAFFRGAVRLRARRWTGPDALLGAEGFALRGRRTSEWGLLRADVWVRD